MKVTGAISKISPTSNQNNTKPEIPSGLDFPRFFYGKLKTRCCKIKPRVAYSKSIS